MNKPIWIRMQFYGGKDSIVPTGVVENLLIEIFDGLVSFRFDDYLTTRKFAACKDSNGSKGIYSERLQKAIYKYPGKEQKELVKEVVKKLNELGAKIKAEDFEK